MKLSQYRAAAAGAGGDSGGEQEQEKLARALLSNTDKEVIFDGLKKLYRKKVKKQRNRSLELQDQGLCLSCFARAAYLLDYTSKYIHTCMLLVDCFRLVFVSKVAFANSCGHV